MRRLLAHAALLAGTSGVLGGCALSFVPEIQDATALAGDSSTAPDSGVTGRDAAPPNGDVGPREDATPHPDAEPRPDAMIPDSGPGARNLTVQLAGNGSGRVSSSPGGIECGATCVAGFPAGALVTLQVSASPGSTFIGWTGDCGGTGLCQLRMTEDRTVSATFEADVHEVSVRVSGGGSGRVVSFPAGIDCGSDCDERFAYGTQVGLAPAPAPGSTFSGWTGDCASSGTSACTLTVDGDKRANARFEIEVVLLRVVRMGNGTGLITSAPGGINCGQDCSEDYNHGTRVVLTANPTGTTVFAGWGGACGGSDLTCAVDLTADTDVTATFDLPRFALTVTLDGGGTGSVTSAPQGIDCGNDCREDYEVGTVVTLLPASSPGSVFHAWTGACTGSGGCMVTMDAAKQVQAIFGLTRHMLTVTKNGAGSGRVTSTPAGVDCGSDCDENVREGTVVTLSAAPDPGSSFLSWGGACTGTGACSVTMNAPRSVTATFDVRPARLIVNLAGSGAGTVTSNPAGISCGPDCSQTFPLGTMVSLTPAPAAGSGFAGWRDACSGAAECTLLMDRDRTVTADFDLGLVAYYPLDGTATDASRNGLGGTIIGNAPPADDHAGRAGGAIELDRNSYVEVMNATSLSGMTAFSVCAWSRASQPIQNTAYLVSKEFLYDNTGSSDAYSLRINAPQPQPFPVIRAWTTTNGNGASAFQPTAFPNQTWVHLCGTYDGITLTMFVNGGLGGTVPLTGTVNPTMSTLRLGRCNGAQNRCNGSSFMGRLDEVKIWRRALSPAEINAEFTR